VKNLRNKLEPDPRKPRYLVTEAGLGYRLRADEGGAGESEPI
jgi:two-component system KDP operon response regulator KdpE